MGREEDEETERLRDGMNNTDPLLGGAGVGFRQ